VLQPDCGELCDDGVNSGAYATCNSDCTLAPHCGDGIIQPEGGEECDSGSQNGFVPWPCSTLMDFAWQFEVTMRACSNRAEHSAYESHPEMMSTLCAPAVSMSSQAAPVNLTCAGDIV